MSFRINGRVVAGAPDIRELRMHASALAVLLASLVALPTRAAEPQRPPQQPQAPKTAKERLSGKDSDEQRVNDCKVPPERRRESRRRAECRPSPNVLEFDPESP